MAERWRVGGKLGRTLYRDGQLVGLVDTREIAAEIVETMNRVGALLDEVRSELADTERGMAEWWAGRQREIADEKGRERSPDGVRAAGRRTLDKIRAEDPLPVLLAGEPMPGPLDGAADGR